jgi:hypothetical protein
MTTAFAAIVGAVVAVLNAGTPVSPNIFRARERALAEEYATAINVQWDGGTPDNGAMQGAPVDWESRVTVECYARSSTTGGDLAVDPLLEQVYQRLAADSTLGGRVANLCCIHIEAQNDAQGQKTGWVGMSYAVFHRTSNLNLS